MLVTSKDLYNKMIRAEESGLVVISEYAKTKAVEDRMSQEEIRIYDILLLDYLEEGVKRCRFRKHNIHSDFTIDPRYTEYSENIKVLSKEEMDAGLRIDVKMYSKLMDAKGRGIYVPRFMIDQLYFVEFSHRSLAEIILTIDDVLGLNDIVVIGGFVESSDFHEKHDVLIGCYFHGSMESKLGYDIVYVPNIVDTTELVSKDSVRLKVKDGNSNEIYDAIGFFWKDNSTSMNRGLIVEVSDYTSISYAVKMKDEESKAL